MKINYILCPILLLAVGACKVEPQNPREIFSDKTQLPAELAAIANPPLKQSQVQTVMKKDLKGRVSVAVIDTGVDYQHPQMYQQIKYTQQNGKIVGAGIDLMGVDTWGHPNLINPLLYSLVATKIEKGKLVGVKADPIQWIADVQKEFSTKLVAAVQANPKLANTVWAKKVIPESFVAFSMVDFVKSATDYAKSPNRPPVVNEANRNDATIIQKYGKKRIDALLDGTWVADSSSGYPTQASSSFFDFINVFSLEGLEEFTAVVKTVYTEVDAKFQVGARLKLYNQYYDLLEDNNTTKTNLGSDIVSAWYKLRFPAASSSVLALIENTCLSATPATRTRLQTETLTNVQKVALARQGLVSRFQVIAKMYQLQLQLGGINSSTKKQIEESIKQLPKYVAMYDEVFKSKPHFAQYLDCKMDKFRLSSKDPGLTQFQVKRNHPYVSDHSEGATHGTHVAGIIAKQSKKIDIVPVRVVTDSTQGVPEVMLKVRANFDAGFKAWYALPEVKKAVSAFIQAKMGGLIAPENVLSSMKTYMDDNFINNYLDYLFFEQIKQAIAYVGRNKVKVANMSLGTSFEKGILNPTNAGNESRVNNFLNFLTYEYFKYAVALTVEKYAANTLFVIASGNDGAWIDGRSRSGLPCDLTSPMMPNTVPNNRLKNILCVGSIDENHDLSSFMNLPLTGVPFVLSYGEAVLSTMKMTACDGASQSMSEDYGKLAMLSTPGIDVSESNYDQLLKDGGFWSVELPDEDIETTRQRAYSALQMYLFDDVSNIPSATAQTRCMSQKRPSARMSGTSMATPAVAGWIARSLVPEMNKRKLTEEQLYNLPEFAPEKIIESLRARSPAFGGPSILKDVSKVVDIKKYKAEKVKSVAAIVNANEIISSNPTP